MKVQKGFTLIELVVVLVILGILAAVAVPNYVDLTTDAKSAACEGIKGALASSAALLIGQNQGTKPTKTAVIAATTIESTDWSVATSSGAGVIDISYDGSVECSTSFSGLTSD